MEESVLHVFYDILHRRQAEANVLESGLLGT